MCCNDAVNVNREYRLVRKFQLLLGDKVYLYQKKVFWYITPVVEGLQILLHLLLLDMGERYGRVGYL